MNIEEPKITTFHFKMDILMINELKKSILFQKIQNLSATINRILLQLFTIIEKEDMEGVQRFSKYKLINEDKSIMRKHVVVKIPDFMYRRLKCLHDVLNYFSLAQLMRDLLRWFLDLVSRFGDTYGKELIRLVKEWIQISNNSRFLLRYIQQLITFEGEIMEIIIMFNIYTLHFTPYREFRL